MLRSQAITNFLADFSQHGLIKYNIELEIQVNTIGEDAYSFRIPKAAKTKPENNDIEITFDLSKSAFAIGCTGWNWVKQQSVWVGYDLDSIINHELGLEHAEISKIIASLSRVDWINLVRSTSGNGYHIYVFLNPTKCPTIANHTEHIALARAILDEIIAVTGLDLVNKIDTHGTILWIWHKNQVKNAFELVSNGVPLDTIPSNWRDYLVRKKGYHRTNEIDFSQEADKLDEEHTKLINWLGSQGYSRWWDSEKQLLVCHTYNLKQAYKELGLNGYFDTVSEGKTGANEGSDHNCFAIPIENGAWIIKRFGINTNEKTCWFRDNNGYATIYFNTNLNFEQLGNLDGINKFSPRAYEIRKNWNAYLFYLGYRIASSYLDERSCILEKTNGNKLRIIIERKNDDFAINGWLAKKDIWIKILELIPNQHYIRVPHNKIRHVVSNGKFAGWYCRTDLGWVEEPKGNIISFLRNEGYHLGAVDEVMGKAIKQHWRLVNEPFQPQYLSKRRWNKFGARLGVEARQGDYPTWQAILNHTGQELNPYLRSHQWCVSNNILDGSTYLFTWIAFLLQHPTEPLPYLFLHGPQNCGKSSFHEMLGLLFKDGQGYVGANNALVNQQGFNEELAKAVLAYVEETDLSDVKTRAYNRIKHWTTALYFTIHPKGKTPFDIRNTTHWVHTSNNMGHCPILPGDTRITSIWVPALKTEIPKSELQANLYKEAGAFLHAALNTELPKPAGRLNLPVIETGEKESAAESNESDIDRFLRQSCFYVEGAIVRFSEFYEKYSEMYPDKTKIELGRLLPPQFPKGMYGGDGQIYIGNISWTQVESTKPKLIRIEGRLKHGTKD